MGLKFVKIISGLSKWVVDVELTDIGLGIFNHNACSSNDRKLIGAYKREYTPRTTSSPTNMEPGMVFSCRNVVGDPLRLHFNLGRALWVEGQC